MKTPSNKLNSIFIVSSLNDTSFIQYDCVCVKDFDINCLFVKYTHVTLKLNI